MRRREMRRDEEEGGGEGEGGDQKNKQNRHLRGEEQFDVLVLLV